MKHLERKVIGISPPHRAGPIMVMCVCALLMWTSQASATTIIDDFEDALSDDDDSSVVLEVNSASTTDTSTQTALAGVLGGDRLATLTYLGGTGAGAESAAQTVQTSSWLDLVNGSDDRSRLNVLYDGDADGAGAGTNLGDLTAGGATQILIGLIKADLNASISLKVTDADSNFTLTEEVTSAVSSPGIVIIFEHADFTGIDFTDVEEVELILTDVDDGVPPPGTEAVDFQVDFIKSGVIPEPLTMLGMFMGLGWVGAYIRKRRMS